MDIKIIFLDVDGVLNYNGYNSELLEIKCVNNLKKIIDITHCKIIISSTYRLSDISFNLLFDELKKYSIMMDKLTISEYLKTPDLEYMSRCDEILYTVNQIKNDKRYNLLSWIVLDDGELLNKELIPYFVKTNYNTGISEENVLSAIFLLNS